LPDIIDGAVALDDHQVQLVRWFLAERCRQEGQGNTCLLYTSRCV